MTEKEGHCAHMEVETWFLPRDHERLTLRDCMFLRERKNLVQMDRNGHKSFW